MTSHSILVADHDPTISDVLKVCLVAQGYAVTITNSSEQALKEGTLSRPQLLLIDPIMPGISGVEVATRLSREINCKVLFVTAFADDPDFKEMVRGLLKQDCDAGIVPKPFDKPQLFECVRRKIGVPPKSTNERPNDGQTVGRGIEGTYSTPSVQENQIGPYETLLELATLNVYQTNAFRITGLDVDASLREVSKEAEKLEMMIKLGRPLSSLGILPLSEIPTVESVKSALQLLQDPEGRLIQELFWFWPCSGQSKDDPALQAMRQGQHKAAVDYWTKSKGLGNGIAIHNLAVFYHLSALDSATRRSKTQEATPTEEIYLWTSAYRYWKALLDRTDFWEALAGRIRMINDPRLKVETSQGIRRTLPNAVVSINAHQAVSAAEKGDFEEAAKHRKLIYTSAFGETLAIQETRRALSHVLGDVERLCENAEKNGRSNPKVANVVARKLLDDKASLLRAFNYLLGVGDRICDAAHDRVAEAARACIVAYVNETEDWETARSMSEECLALAEGKALRLKLEEDLEIIGRNLIAQRQSQSPGQSSKPPVGSSSPLTEKATPNPAAKGLKRNRMALASFVGVVVLFAATKGCDDSNSPASSPATTNAAIAEPASQSSPSYTGRPAQTESKSLFESRTNSAQLKVEIESDSQALDVLEGELKLARSGLDEYDSVINIDKSSLERMKRDNNAGIEVDENIYETTRHRYNANIDEYNQLLTEYKTKLAHYNELLAATNAKIVRYNSHGGTR